MAIYISINNLKLLLQLIPQTIAKISTLFLHFFGFFANSLNQIFLILFTLIKNINECEKLKKNIVSQN